MKNANICAGSKYVARFNDKILSFYPLFFIYFYFFARHSVTEKM